MKRDIQLAVFDVSGATVKNKGEITEGGNAQCLFTVADTTGTSYTKEQLELYHPDYIIDSLKELPALL
jgi:phosphoglycolate phosphatase-like HAD superfamily hydrolase